MPVFNILGKRVGDWQIQAYRTNVAAYHLPGIFGLEN